MLTAKNQKNKIINLANLSLCEKKNLFKEKFVCCLCQGRVQLRIGEINKPHFAHIRLNDCFFSYENESDEHLELKTELYHSLSNHRHHVLIEKILPEFNQIADLLVNKTVALEIQCSALPQQRLLERSKNYQDHGFKVLWLLGRKLWLKSRISSLQKQFLYYSNNIGFHLWELDLNQKCLRLKYMIYEDLKGRVHYLEKNCLFNDDLLNFLRFPFQKQRMSSYQVEMPKDIIVYIQKQLYYKSSKWLRKQEQAYHNGENLLMKDCGYFFPQVRPITCDRGFAQVTCDLSQYYLNFESYYEKVSHRSHQILYPPKFYDTIQ